MPLLEKLDKAITDKEFEQYVQTPCLYGLLNTMVYLILYLVISWEGHIIRRTFQKHKAHVQLILNPFIVDVVVINDILFTNCIEDREGFL